MLAASDPGLSMAALLAADVGKAREWVADTLGDLAGHNENDARLRETLDRYILPNAKPEMPLYHLVSAVDPIVAADLEHRINDGLPETLVIVDCQRCHTCGLYSCVD